MHSLVSEPGSIPAADPRFPIREGWVVGELTSDMSAFWQKRLQKQKNWIPFGLQPDSQSLQPEMTLVIVVRKQQKSAGNDWSTLTLKLMGGVIPSLKQKAKWTSVQQKYLFKKWSN